MARIGLVIYLILLGPGELICPCCALSFVTSDLQGTCGGVPSCPCCPGMPPSEQSPSGPKCPCQVRAENVALPSARTQQARQAPGKIRDCVFPAPHLWLPNNASLNANLWSSVRVDGAFLSPRDRLHVICLLRC
jgi:hypothetical protein